MECIRYLLRTQGVRGLYKGVVIQGVRDIPASIIYFLVYESLFRAMTERRLTDRHGIAASLVSGGTAGVVSWLAIMPFDNVKSLYQADKDRVRFRSMLDCARQTYTQRGVAAFYTGSVMACCRAFPVNAVIFLVHTQCLKLFDGLSSSSSSSSSSSPGKKEDL